MLSPHAPAICGYRGASLVEERYKVSHAFTVRGVGVQYTVTGVGDHRVKLQTSPTT